TEIESVFEVEGQAGMSISKLKDMIYDKKKNNFEGKGFDPSDLHLWKVDIPGDTKNVKLETLESRSHDINNENTTIQELGGRRLTPFESLGDIFDNDSKNIRIIAQPPTTESPMKKRRLWYRDPKEANVIQDSSNKDQKVPVSESEFKRVREYRKLYVDKTEWLTRLELNSGQYFVSRPRKFGKSMFLSMVESFFLVQYNLFENLYIRDHPPNIFINNKAEKWSENLPSIPVIRLDFSLLTSDEGPEKLKKSLIRVLQLAGEEYDIDIDTDTANYDVKGATLELITSLAGDDKNEYRQVVILIDEYDSPLLNVIGITKENTQIANDSHGVLKSFFEVIKALQSKVKFLLVTGVTMFAHLGLFSGLNNLKDITLSDELSGAYGFTGDEITKAFGDKLSNLCKSDDHYRDVQDAMNRLQKKYN
ncbi:12303_t:CDS:2, partial [Funneliformis geosporum]